MICEKARELAEKMAKAEDELREEVRFASKTKICPRCARKLIEPWIRFTDGFIGTCTNCRLKFIDPAFGQCEIKVLK